MGESREQQAEGRRQRYQKALGRTQKAAIALCLLLTAYCLLPSGDYEVRAEEFRVGYVDLAKLFDQYQRTKESERVLEQKGKQKQTDLENRVTELKKLRQNLELLNEQVKEAKAKELEEKSEEFQQLKTRTERDLLRERNQLAQQILGEIERVVGEYAKTNHFSLILDQRSLLFGEEAHDVTDEVLMLLNDRYAATKGSKPKP